MMHVFAVIGVLVSLLILLIIVATIFVVAVGWLVSGVIGQAIVRGLNW